MKDANVRKRRMTTNVARLKGASIMLKGKPGL